MKTYQNNQIMNPSKTQKVRWMRTAKWSTGDKIQYIRNHKLAITYNPASNSKNRLIYLNLTSFLKLMNSTLKAGKAHFKTKIKLSISSATKA